jgi:hypothetical protein
MKRKALAALLLVPFHALADTASIQNDQLFIEVWNGNSDDTGASYIKALKISLPNLLDYPGCYNGVVADLTQDATYTSAAASNLGPDALWTVKSAPSSGLDTLINDAASDPQNAKNHSGFVSTVQDAENLADPSYYPSYTDPVTALSGHLGSAGVPLGGSKAFVAADLGYFYEEGWNEYMGDTVGVNTSKKVADEGTLGMYFFTVSGEDFATGVMGKNGQPLGEWSFDGKQLRFTSATAAPATCPSPEPDPGTGTDTGNGGGTGTDTGTDTGNGGGTDTGTDTGTGTNPDSTPTDTSGGTSNQGTSVNLKMVSPKPGDTLQAGIRQSIGWTSGNVDSKQRLKLYYSKDGGSHWKLIKKGLRVNGYYLWKPRKKHLSEQGLLAVCLSTSKTSLAECDVTDGVFSIKKAGEVVQAATGTQ